MTPRPRTHQSAVCHDFSLSAARHSVFTVQSPPRRSRTFSTHRAVTLPDVAEISGRRRRHPQMLAVVCRLTPVGCRTEDSLFRGIGTHRFPVQKSAYCISDIKHTTWALRNREAYWRPFSQLSWCHLKISLVAVDTGVNGYLVLGTS